jgi:hypothetical protein
MDLSVRCALEAAGVILIGEHGGAGADVRLRKPQRKRFSAGQARSADRSDFDEDELSGFGVRLAKKKKKR